MKYLKTYKQINEGLRDKMVGKPIEAAEKYLEKLSDKDRIRFVLKNDLDHKFLPRDEEGWCIFDGDFVPSFYDLNIPEKFKILGDFMGTESIGLDELPNDLNVYGNFNLSKSNITKIPKGFYVEGDISLNSNKITELPDNFTTNGDLRILSNRLTKLPKNLTINGTLNCTFNRITEISEGLNVKNDFYINTMNQLKKLPNDVKIGGSIQIISNGLKSLPENLTVNGHLNLMDNKLTKLPKGLHVRGDLIIINNPIDELHEDLIVEGSLYIKNTKMSLKDIKKPDGVNEII